MDQASVDINVLFPTHVSSYCALRDLDFENALYELITAGSQISRWCGGRPNERTVALINPG